MVGACSPSNNTKTSNKDPHTEPPGKLTAPTEDTSAGLSKIPSLQKACEVFLESAASGLELHLVAPKNDSTFLKMLKSGMALVLESEKFKKEEVEAWTKKYNEDDLKTCKPYFDLADIKYKNAVLRAQKKEDASLKESIGLTTLRTALSASLYSLDPYSRYNFVTKEELNETDKVYGPGIILDNRTDLIFGRRPKYFIIRDIPPNSPNHDKRAELLYRRLHAVTHIDESGKKTTQPASSLSLEEINELLNIPSKKLTPNDQKKTWTLTISDSSGPNTGVTRDVEVRRGTYVPTVAYHMQYGFEIAYIKLLTFGKAGSAEDFKRALSNIESTSTTLIFDLRGNGGGSILEMEEIVRLFLPPGSVYGYQEFASTALLSNDEKKLSQRGLQNNIPTTIVKNVLKPASPKDPDLRIPERVILLLDRYSASASELLAGIFKDYGVSTNIGETPFGKGIGQRHLAVAEPLKGYLQVTDEYIFTPSGKSHHLNASKLIDISLVDPILEKASAVFESYGDKKFKTTMFTHLEKDGRVTIPAPRSPLNVSFSPPSPTNTLSPLSEPNAFCAHPIYPEDPLFIEEVDCILATAIDLARDQN